MGMVQSAADSLSDVVGGHLLGHIRPNSCVAIRRFSVSESGGMINRASSTGNLIPQELIDLIVDHLRGDISTLKSCCLAARAFAHSAQAHVFSKIAILPPSLHGAGPSPCQKLYKLLTSSPDLAPLVNELYIVIVGSETSFDYNSDGQYLVRPHAPWLMSGRSLALVLPLLKLKRIALVEKGPWEWNMRGEYGMNWNRMGRTLKSALTAVFSSPLLESVHLRGIVVDSPAQLFSLFSETTSLKEMSLSRVYFNQRWDARDAWPESQLWRPRLRSLLVSDVGGDSLCRYFLNPRIDLNHLASVTVATDLDEWKRKLVQVAVSSATEHLCLFRPLPDFLPSVLGANLRSIHYFTTDMFQLIAAAFAAYTRESCLETIVFEGPARGVATRTEDAKVDSALVHLPNLKTVEVKAYFLWADMDMPFNMWSAQVQASLPSLVRRGLLTLTQIQRADRDVHHGWE
ncbi:hypothetical protein DFH07DRAFT_955434 [Mycena maculata]|uniref:Uncharacterized protein n=1 Tax=Mycena maculata TaxID=230809 RepID=A0AAD7JNV8_9AGAR|nr:hypothetical protein DFH07DRAFT_955434 [Mycena maculata]